MMDKQHCNEDGYALLNLLLCMLLIGMMTLLSTQSIKPFEEEPHRFYYEYLRIKSEAMLESSRKEYPSSTNFIYFNEKGNVNQAQTVQFPNPRNPKTFTIQLGTGALIEK